MKYLKVRPPIFRGALETMAKLTSHFRESACVHCGYLLQGISPYGHCPECGLSIQVSRRYFTIAGASRDWLRGITYGTFLAGLSTALWLLIFASQGFVPLVLSYLLLLFTIVLFVAGVLVLCQKGDSIGHFDRVRRRVLVGCAVAVLGIFTFIATTSGWSGLTAGAIVAISCNLLLLPLALLLCFVNLITPRIGLRRLSRDVRVCSAGSVVVFAGLMAIPVLFEYVGGAFAVADGHAMPFVFFTLLVYTIAVIVVVWSTIVFLRMTCGASRLHRLLNVHAWRVSQRHQQHH